VKDRDVPSGATFAGQDKKERDRMNKETRMTAPPSQERKIVKVPELFPDLIAKHAFAGRFVHYDETDSPWVPFGENAAIKHLLFDTRHNIYSNILWMKGPSVVGTHKHRGYVVMMCLEGSVHYLEYDWLATPGCFIYETPGEAHTLVTDHPDGCKLFGWMQGPNEFYDSDGNMVMTADVWWFMDHYESYCRANDIPINPQLYL
jgi:2,4'-dihydroxyacetophenone dioxygenase